MTMTRIGEGKEAGEPVSAAGQPMLSRPAGISTVIN